jgi:hypothetical protein
VRVLPATPEPTIGVVSWNMNTTCNYRCSYCTQRFLDDRTRWAKDVDRFLDGFARLASSTPGVQWEVKLSGGEPFLHPRFLDVVAGLRARSFLVGVVTNLSASGDTVAQFLDAAGDGLTVMSCSLHLEYVDTDAKLDAFLAKCDLIRARITSSPRGCGREFSLRANANAAAGGEAPPSRPRARLVVTSVATHAFLPRLAALKVRFDDAGVSFKVQPEKQDGAVVDYQADEVNALVQLGGHNGHGVVAHDFRGQPCWSGSRAIIVDDRGEAFRCYPARRKKTERLGNLLDGTLTLLDGAQPCRYSYCNCTVPIARGMMPIEGARDRFANVISEISEGEVA